MKHTKQRLAPSRPTMVPVLAPDAAVVPRSKARKLSLAESHIFTADQRRRYVYDSVRLSQPAGGNLVYSVAEAVGIINSLASQNQVHPPRTYLDAVKQTMVDELRIPVQRTQINRLLKVTEERKALPTYWNRRGPPDIMSLADLRSRFDENAKREGSSWTHEQTERALIDKMRQKLTNAGVDASTLKPPHEKTVQAYHSALMSMADLAS